MTVLVSEGDDFERTVASVMYHARTIISRVRQPSPAMEAELKSLEAHVKPADKLSWYDGLGFCMSGPRTRTSPR